MLSSIRKRVNNLGQKTLKNEDRNPLKKSVLQTQQNTSILSLRNRTKKADSLSLIMDKQNNMVKSITTIQQTKKRVISNTQHSAYFMSKFQNQQFDEKYSNDPFFKMKMNLLMDQTKKRLSQHENSNSGNKQNTSNNEPQFYMTLKGKKLSQNEKIKQIYEKTLIKYS